MANFHLKDHQTIRTKALPAQNSTAFSDSIDLKMKGAGPIDTVLLLKCPATPSLASGQTLTFRVQDSADNSSFADVVGYGGLVITGGGSGGAATDFPPLKLHKHVRRYLRVAVDASATAGNNTGVSFEVALAQG